MTSLRCIDIGRTRSFFSSRFSTERVDHELCILVVLKYLRA